MTVESLNKASFLEPERKVEIKRRLDDGSGNYETDWFDVTDKFVSFGTISWKVDSQNIGVFVQNHITLVGDNTNKEWDNVSVSESIFSGFLTRYRTLFKITIALKDSAGDFVPANTASFFGLLNEEIQLTETEAIIPITSNTQIFRELSASNLSLSATDTASDIVTKVLALEDDDNNNAFDTYLSGTYVGTTSVQYPDVVSPANQTAWDVITRMAITEDFVAFIDNDGTFQFRGRNTGTTPVWKFIGAGVFDETYGVNIIAIKNSKDAWRKVKNFVQIEHTSGSYTTSRGTWAKGDGSSPDIYGEQPLRISEFWLGSTNAQTLADNLRSTYKHPKKEVVLTSSTINPSLQLLDPVEVTYLGEPSTGDPGIWGVSVFGSAYSEGVGLWTGRKGGITLDEELMRIIGIDYNLDNTQSKYILREI